MSTDTDYVIKIKGKKSLREAAADFIELLLKPWSPGREDMVTLVRLDVFRNESTANGLFEPPDLCEEAAKMFTGITTSFKSKNEYGVTDSYEWTEDGVPPKDIDATVAQEVLNHVQKSSITSHHRVNWLDPLAKWASEHCTPKDTIEQIASALADAHAAMKAVKAEEVRQIKNETAGALALESKIRWSFHPGQTAENRPIGKLGKSFLMGKTYGREPSAHFIPCNSASFDDTFSLLKNEGWEYIGVAIQILPNSKAAKKFLKTQFSARGDEDTWVVIRTPNGIRWLGKPDIYKEDDSFFIYTIIHNMSLFHKALPLAELYEESEVCEILDKRKIVDHTGHSRQICPTLCRIDAHVFLATHFYDYYVGRKDRFQGRFFCLSADDGSMVWASDVRYCDCKSLVASDKSTILATVSLGNDAFFVCLDATTGKELWRRKCDSEIRDMHLATSRNTAISAGNTKGSDDLHSLFGWRINTGEIVFEKRLESPPSSTAMDSERAYVAGEEYLKAFTLDGEDAWTIHLPGEVRDLALTGNGSLLVSRGEHGITLIDCESGKTLWTVNGNCEKCVVGGNGTFFSDADQNIVARSIRDGSLLWQAQCSGYLKLATDKFVVVSNINGILKCLDVASGVIVDSINLGTIWHDAIPAPDGSLLCTGGTDSDQAFGYNNASRLLFCIDAPT